ncbi:DUF2161 domain-containing phosphodiesterase [Pseudoroseicyclus sp. CXY001]|uniref:DUF2161 domain-containing phosphodiesterase n=1 Tax=Pseudoroseicyclus sp. CXY001 TaxID=3242492 RepID=UPI0035713577
MTAAPPREQDLYAPVKALLEGQGYVVKAEIGAADLVALRGEEPPLIVELKRAFSLALVHQGIARQAVTDAVYLAVERGRGRRWQAAMRANRALCRRLGLGLILVAGETVEVALDPAPYTPRQSAARKARLLKEFARREGDPNVGGMARRGGVVTAYRQEAQRIAAHLAAHGPCRGAEVARATGVARATRMMADDYFGWFERVSRGVYGLTEKGRAALPAGGPEAAGDHD